MHSPLAIRIHTEDDVAVALRVLDKGAELRAGEATVVVREQIPAGHKVALRHIGVGETVRKYGFPIGCVTRPIEAGTWVHSHNLQTRLTEQPRYTFSPPRTVPAGTVAAPPTFLGYRRTNGRVGTRNEIWVLNTVGCVNTAAARIATVAAQRLGDAVEGVYSFGHPFGCSQLGDDLAHTQRILAGLLRHPNAGGVLVLGLGCENNQLEDLLRLAPDVDRARLRFFNTQEVMHEVEEGVAAAAELAGVMEADRRTEQLASELVLGHKCGGSDGFSGLSANPLLGRIADRVSAFGGSILLTEVPEMFGAEQLLMNRAANEDVFQSIVRLIEDFKSYFREHNQPIYENPSPGNKAGGLTTLEEKSLGAVQKGGSAPVTGVVRYGQPASNRGLLLLEAPGNDGVSSTAMVASGATLLLFTTGRGTPLGFPVPTLKISSNSTLAMQKPHWIDFDAGPAIDGTRSLDALADDLLECILDVASGRRRARNEENESREIAIWKEGVTL